MVIGGWRWAAAGRNSIDPIAVTKYPVRLLASDLQLSATERHPPPSAPSPTVAQCRGGMAMTDADFLMHVALFSEFERGELNDLGLLLRPASYKAGTILLEEGAINRGLHIVRSGKVQVSRTVDEDEVVLGDLVKGQSFGEMSILEDGFTSARLRVIEDSEILTISINNLGAFLAEHPLAAAKFWRAMAIDLRRRLLQANDLVRKYFEVNRALIENPMFRDAYSLITH